MNDIYALKSVKLKSIKSILNLRPNEVGEVNQTFFFLSALPMITPLVFCFITFGVHPQVQGNHKVIFNTKTVLKINIYIFL